MRLLSIQVGTPRSVEDALGGRRFRSGICKRPVSEPLHLGPAGLPGDGQESLRYHGGPDKAILCYAAEHYPLWREELGRAELPFGSFGENLTTEGLTEEAVCLGDRYAIGAALLEVTEPRGPCSKLARWLGVADMVARVRSTGRAGWYCRVIEAGEIWAGAPISLHDRPAPAWPMARVARILADRDAAEAAVLVALPGLAVALNRALCKVIRPGG